MSEKEPVLVDHHFNNISRIVLEMQPGVPPGCHFTMVAELDGER